MKKSFLTITSAVIRFIPTSVKKGLYRLGPISTWIRQILNYFSPDGLSIMTISSGKLANLQMSLDMKKEKDYWLGTYEIDLQDMISSKVEEGWIAYDVGANIGYFSLLFARVVGKSGNVFSFEAVPENITRLQANLRLNEIGTRIKIVPAAVLDKTGKVKFLLGPSGAMGKVDGSAGRENLHQESIEVDGISLDDFVYKDRNPPPDVIKMDIEGGEVLAVKGMQKLLKEHPPLIFLEIHGKVAAQSVWQDLSNTGYKMFKLKPGLPPLRSWKELDWKTYLVAEP